MNDELKGIALKLTTDLSGPFYNASFNDRLLYNTLLKAVHKAGCFVVATAKHNFNPVGHSSVVIIGESHAAVHSTPENDLVFVTYISCADDPHFEAFEETWENAGFKIMEKTDFKI